MKRLGVLLALLVLGSLLTVGTGTVKAETTGYVLIHLKNPDWVFNTTALNSIDWNYPGIGNISWSLVDDKTLRIDTPALVDFLKLFAPPGYSTSKSAHAPSRTILDDILNRISTAGAVVDTTLGSTVTVTLNDVILSNSYGYGSVKVTVLGQDTYNGEDYSVTVNVTGTAYVFGWRNNRGTVTVDGNDVSSSFCPNPYSPVTLSEGLHTISTTTGATNADGYTTIVFSIIALQGSNYTVSGKLEHSNYEVVYNFERLNFNVQFSFRNALSSQPLNGVTVKENGQVLGTLDDGGSLELAKGQHTLTFEKSGYWSVTKTIDVENDTSLSVEMYPSSAAFKLENFPADISIPENTIYTLTFTLSPIQTSATYNTYLSISGLQNLISVKKGDSVVSPEGGKYYLGDISGPTQVSITFQAGAVGQHGFTLSIESHDAVMSKTYTTTKSVTYTVEPLPFSVQMPSEWQVGQNELRISESSGQSYLVTVVLKDSQGNEVWSDSHAFNPYEAYTFTPKIPSEGSYTLELTWNGKTAIYSVQVNPAITLKTKTLSVKKGSEGMIILHFKNPSSDVQYYTIKVSGGFLPAEINQSISVAPATEKDVSIAFAVPDKLTYDAYELNVQVLQGNATVFSDKVAVSISDSSGFSLFGGGSSGGKTLYYAVGALVALGLFIAAARRR